MVIITSGGDGSLVHGDGADYRRSADVRRSNAAAAAGHRRRRMNRPPPDRGRGIALMVGAGLCWSSGGLIVRSLGVANAWEIVFWRALFMALFVAVLLIALQRRGAWAQVRGIGRAGVVSAFFLAAQIYLFILALRNTSTANTFVLMSLAPLVTALAGRLFLGERVAWITWGAIAVALMSPLVPIRRLGVLRARRRFDTTARSRSAEPGRAAHRAAPRKRAAATGSRP